MPVKGFRECKYIIYFLLSSRSLVRIQSESQDEILNSKEFHRLYILLMRSYFIKRYQNSYQNATITKQLPCRQNKCVSE